MEENKLDKLRSILNDIGSIVIAFSGGVDSTFLAKVAANVLKDKVLAVTVVSALLPNSEKIEAARLAKEIRVKHQFLPQELAPELLCNQKDRCYHCKKSIFSGLLHLARQKGLSAVIDGSNADDISDYRPGTKALKELKIRSPLQEAGFTKTEIRALSKKMGLDTWNKPAMACLASRFEYGDTLSREKLKTVERCEDLLRALGLKQVRARHHGNLCRIEAGPDSITCILKNKESLVKKIKSLGYKYVTIDLQGYRTGSMNEVLPWKKKR